MESRKGKNVIHVETIHGIRVVRFLQPDVRAELDGDLHHCTLLRELQLRVLDGLEEGQSLVLNLGLIDMFPTALYSCLLKLREAVLARKARLVLCRLSPEHREIFELFRAERLFQIVHTEALALRQAGTRCWAPDKMIEVP
jgi:anti-anti-sigma regulatory factor